jgi:uncharacterized protein (TIGR02284 family)
METKEKEEISLLNDLIIINNDRIEGYVTAAKETTDADLKVLFNDLAKESREFKNDLFTEVIALNGKPAEGTKITGKMYRAWMEVKTALTGKDRKKILSSCEFGEDIAAEEYDKVLKSEDLDETAKVIVTKQREKLHKSHDRIKALRDGKTV